MQKEEEEEEEETYELAGFKRSVALDPQMPVHTTRTDRTGTTRTDRTGVRRHISSTRTDHTDRTDK